MFTNTCLQLHVYKYIITYIYIYTYVYTYMCVGSYVEACKEVAKEYDVPCIDTFDLMQGGEEERAGYLRDGLHLNER